MPEVAYFDSALWVAILADEPSAHDILTLILDIKEGRGRILTSILTLTEISVRAYREDPTRVAIGVELVSQTASICNVTDEVALLTARIEAMYPSAIWAGEEGPRRRRWDALHLASAAVFGARIFYTLDRRLLNADLSAVPEIPPRRRPQPPQASLNLPAVP